MLANITLTKHIKYYKNLLSFVLIYKEIESI